MSGFYKWYILYFIQNCLVNFREIQYINVKYLKCFFYKNISP